MPVSLCSTVHIDTVNVLVIHGEQLKKNRNSQINDIYLPNDDGSMALIKNEGLDAKEELNKTTQGEI